MQLELRATGLKRASGPEKQRPPTSWPLPLPARGAPPGWCALSEAGGLEVKGVDSEARWAGEFQLYLFIGCVTGFKLCDCSEPQFPNL